MFISARILLGGGSMNRKQGKKNYGEGEGCIET